MWSIDKQGSRIYVRGTYYGDPSIPKLKSLGAHWDPQERAWWVGTAKQSDIEQLVNKVNGRKEAYKERASQATIPVKIPFEMSSIREDAKKLGAIWDAQNKMWMFATQDLADRIKQDIDNLRRMAPSPPPPFPRRERYSDDVSIGEKSDIHFLFRVDDKPTEANLGTSYKAKDGTYYTSIGLDAYYVSAEQDEDMDIFHGGRHWAVTKYFHPATDAEIVEREGRYNAKVDQKRFHDLCMYYTTGGATLVSDRYGTLDPEIDRSITSRELIWTKQSGYSTYESFRTNLGLLSFHPVYDDSPQYWLLKWEDMTQEDASLIRSMPVIR